MAEIREIRLTSRPHGAPTSENFELVKVELPEPGPGEVQVRNRWMSVDPAMRVRMQERPSYAQSFKLGETMAGRAIGEVVASNVEGLRPGDWVLSMLGWREAFTAPADQLQKLDLRGLPANAFLGIAGATGLTAYVGLLRIAELKPNDVVFVSAAAGAVGSAACQIAKLRGHTVIGSAGGEPKTRYLVDELKIDAAIDYKLAQGSLAQTLKHAAPDGIDVYFDNVGGEHLEAAIANARPSGRVALCGMISTYNDETAVPGPNNLMLCIGRGLTLRGYLLSQHMDMQEAFLEDVSAWHASGELKMTETIMQGLDRAPEAFIGLFRGDNIGKMVVQLG